MAEDNNNNIYDGPILEEVVWRDDLIRWEGGLHGDTAKKKNTSDANIGDDDSSSDDGQSFLIDPFADPDPFEMFHFDFALPSAHHPHISRKKIIQIKGYKTDAEQIWQSTGLTLWRASHYLCDYQVEHFQMFQNKRVLELGAGLGLNGILAWRLSTAAVDEVGNESDYVVEKVGEVCITDGDSDALVHLRENVGRNRPSNDSDGTTNTSKVSCHQLIWGKESSEKFLSQIAHNQKYDVLLASDIIYSAVIVEPLWETVQTLLEKEGGVFVMAFARRKVPVSIDLVLETALEKGFGYELVKEDLDEGIWVYEFRFS